MKFEEQNAISVNVFSYDYPERVVNGKTMSAKIPSVYPVYISKHSYESIVDLLLIFEECVDGRKKYHYTFIKDLNRASVF